MDSISLNIGALAQSFVSGELLTAETGLPAVILLEAGLEEAGLEGSDLHQMAGAFRAMIAFGKLEHARKLGLAISDEIKKIAPTKIKRESLENFPMPNELSAAAISVQHYSDGSTGNISGGMKAIATPSAVAVDQSRSGCRDPLEEIRGFMKIRRYHKALVELQRFLKEEIGQYDRELQADAYSMLGSCFRHVNDYKSAIYYHQRAAELARSQSQHLMAEIERAMDWRAIGDLRRALFILDHRVLDKLYGVEDMSIYSRAFRIKSLFLRELGEYDEALRILKALYRNGQETEITLREMVMTLWMQGKGAEALAVLERLITLDSEEELPFPHSIRLRNNLILKAEMLWASGRKNQAEQMMTDLIVRLSEIHPAPLDLKYLIFPFFVQWIYFLEDDGRNAEARGALREATSYGIYEESLRRGIEGKRQGMFVKNPPVKK